jgi:polyphenol oxidase
MNNLIYPDIFDGAINAFFTSKLLGADIGKISNALLIKKENVYLPIQKHTDKVLLLDSDLNPGEADAVITRRRDLLIGVQVADCVPILLFERRRSVIGAVHAGWRGTVSQILKKALNGMIEFYDSKPEDIRIALGPSIKGTCYEVGQEVKDAMYNAMGDGEYYTSKNGKYYIDLPFVNVLQAIAMGVPKDNIWLSDICTHCNPSDFHSYRYHGDHSGRQGGFIGVL